MILGERQSKCEYNCIHHLTLTLHICVVDVGFGFEQCDSDIGTAENNNFLQRRIIKLRTHNDTDRQSKCVGIPHAS